jgi:hypothetical protein
LSVGLNDLFGTVTGVETVKVGPGLFYGGLGFGELGLDRIALEAGQRSAGGDALSFFDEDRSHTSTDLRPYLDLARLHRAGINKRRRAGVQIEI